MTIQVGRFGLDITIPNPQQMTRQGDSLMIAGWATGANRTELDVLVAQINNLKGPDEPVVPVVYSYDSTFNGYYRIESAGITDFTPDHERLFKFKYTISLTKISAYGVVECLTAGADRANKPATMVNAFGPRPWHAVPHTWSGYDYNNITNPTAVLTPSSRNLFGGGTVDIYDMVHNAGTPAADFYNLTVQVGADPSNYYDAQTKIQLGATKYTAIGRQVVNDPTHWRITNGLVQIDNSSGAGNHFTMSFVRSNGSQYDTAWGYAVGSTGAPFTILAGVTPRSLTILRNTPWVVSIRLAYRAYAGTSGSVTLDVTLRRGSRYATFVIRSAILNTWAMKWESAAASSYIDPFASGWTAGSVESANNADGHRRVMLAGAADGAAVLDNTNSMVYINTIPGSYIECAQGMQLNGAGTAPDRAVDYQLAFFAAVNEHDRIAAQ